MNDVKAGPGVDPAWSVRGGANLGRASRPPLVSTPMGGVENFEIQSPETQFPAFWESKGCFPVHPYCGKT